MKTTFISTAATTAARLESMARLQRQASELQLELSSGRHADLGLTLGSRISESISLRAERTNLDNILKTNALVSNRFDLAQSTMGEIGDLADAFVSTLVALRDNPEKASLAIEAATSGLDEFTSKLNVSYGGQFVFAGINTGQTSLNVYSTSPASPAKIALDAAFLIEFGVTQSDPSVAAIAAGDMELFLDGAFSSLFDATGWAADWTNASSEQQSQQIEPGQFIDVGPTAREGAFAEIATAFAMIADLGLENMNASAFNLTVDKAVETVASGREKLNTLRAVNGFSEERITRSERSMQLKLNYIGQQLSSLEEVDPYATSTQLSNVLNALEISYAVTAKIQNLSLVRYI